MIMMSVVSSLSYNARSAVEPPMRRQLRMFVCADVVHNGSLLAVCHESGDIAVADSGSLQFAVMSFPNGRIRRGTLPCPVFAIRSMHFLAFNPATRSHYLCLLLGTETGSLICVYDCYEDEDEQEQLLIELALMMPISTESAWNKDYGAPHALLPIPHHTSGVALMCEKAVCVIDFRILYSAEKVRSVEVTQVPMKWPSVELSPESSIPVHLIREFFFKSKKLSSFESESKLIWDQYLRESRRATPSAVLNKLIAFDFGPDSEGKHLDGNMSRSSLTLCLEDGTVETIHISFDLKKTHTVWRMLSTEAAGSIPLHSGLQLKCLPYGHLFFYSESLEHVLVGAELKGNEVVYKRVQSIENSGPIADVVIRQSRGQETGRVLYTACPLDASGSVKVVSSGVVVEDLCVSPQFGCLTHLWKIRPSTQHSSREFLVASFLNETRILLFKEGVFVDGTHLTGILANEPTIYCAALNHTFFIQVTPTRVALCALRVSEHSKAGKASLHSKHISTSNLEIEDVVCEPLPRRWSFSNFSPQQLSSFLRLSERTPPLETEAPECIWEASPRKGLPNGHDGSSLTPRGFLDMNLWGRKPEKVSPAQLIICAAVYEEIICLFTGINRELVVLIVEDVSQSGMSYQSRKRGRSATKIKTLLSHPTQNLDPSCMTLSSDAATGDLLCVMGTYQPSVVVYSLNLKDKKCRLLWSLGDRALYNPLVGTLQEAAIDSVLPGQRASCIPETVAIMETPDANAVPCLLIAFRNGVLGEYMVHKGWQGATRIQLMELGVLPVRLDRIRSDLVLAYSNRSFLLKMEGALKQGTQQRYGIGSVQQINLPSLIKNCVVLTTPSDVALWKESEAESMVELPSILERCYHEERLRYLFAYADSDGMLHLAHVPRQIRSIELNDPVEKLIALPNRHQLLAVSKFAGIYVVDAKNGRVQLCYEARNKECIFAACLWPSADAMVPPSSASLDPVTPFLIRRERHGSTSRTEFKLRNYVKGMAAALTCCHGFINCPSSESTPRQIDAECPLRHSSSSKELFLVVGTGTRCYAEPSLEPIARGSLRLLKIEIAEEGVSQWKTTSIGHRRMPDAVGSLAPFSDSTLMVGVGSRLVPYQFFSGRWEKSANWRPIRDPATSLRVRNEVVVTGDDFNSVVLYNYTWQRSPSPDNLAHLMSGRKARNIVDLQIGENNAITAIDNRGNVLFFSPGQLDNHTPEKNLSEEEILPIGHYLTSITPTTILNGVTEYRQRMNPERRYLPHAAGSEGVIVGEVVENAYLISSVSGAVFLVSRTSSGVPSGLHL